jgi:hypothetical protein
MVEYIKYIKDIIETYFTNDIKEQILTYYRVFFIYYIILIYIEKNNDATIIKGKFFDILNKVIDELKIKTNNEIIKKNFLNHYDELYKTFFIDHNIYFHTYFNNLTKHFLPFPNEYIDFCPYLTYRKNVNNLIRKSDIDYLDKIRDIDTVNQRSFVKRKNIDATKNEINLEINLDIFDLNIFDDNYLFAFDDNKYLFIGKKEGDIIKIIMRREKLKYNIKHYELGIPFKLLFPEWEEYNDNYSINEITYLCVLKKVTKNDMFSVFKKISFNKDKYKELYHNTSLFSDKETYEKLLNNPTFFYFTPLGEVPNYMNNRKCIEYKINTNIDEILDLTSSIVTSNGFTEFMIKNKDFKFLNYSKVDDYYNEKTIPIISDPDSKCLSLYDKDGEKFRKERIWCDTGLNTHYVGRRKLQELVYKTRKFDSSKILYIHIAKKLYKDLGYKIDDIKKANYDNDVELIIKLNLNGFFFTDYFNAINSGGELYLTKPLNYISIKRIGNMQCKEINTFKDKFNVPENSKNMRESIEWDIKKMAPDFKPDKNFYNIFDNKYIYNIKIKYNSKIDIDNEKILWVVSNGKKYYKYDKINNIYNNIIVKTYILYDNWIYPIEISNNPINNSNDIGTNDFNTYIIKITELLEEIETNNLIDKYRLQDLKMRIKNSIS